MSDPRSTRPRSVRRHLATAVLLGCTLLTGLTGCTSSNCGDYDLRGGRYVSNPGRGEYVKNGSDYEYVGCNKGSGGRGGVYGSGGSTRGGGPGTGK